MAVDAAIAVAMTERHIVAVGIAIGGGSYRAGSNGVNRRTLRSSQVNAAVEPAVAPNGMDPPAVGTGYIAADASGQRGNKAGAAGRNIGRRAGASHIVLVLLCQALCLLGGEGCLIGGLRLHDLLAERLLLRLIGQVFVGEVIIGGGQVEEQSIRFCALGFQGLFLLGQSVLDFLLRRQLRLQCLAILLDLLGDALQLGQHTLVGLSHLLDAVNPAQEVGKAGCLEEHSPIGNGAGLLHGAKPRLVCLIHLLLTRHGVLQLRLLFSNEQAILLNESIAVLDLCLGDGDLLIDIGLLVDGRLGAGLIGVDLLLERGALVGDLLRLILEAIDGLLDLRGRGCANHGHERACHQAAHHQHTQHQGDNHNPGAAARF